MKKLTKEQVYVLIDNQPDCDRAIEILTKAGEKMWKDTIAFEFGESRKYLKMCSDGDWVIDYSAINQTQVTLDDLERILMPKIKKAELLERIEKLEEYVKELIDNPKVTIVHPPTWANDPSTVIGKGTIEIEEENPLEKITGVNESVEALKNMLLRKGVLTEQDFDGHFAIQQYGTDNTYPTREIVIDAIEAEKPAFEVGKVYKGENAIMFYCTRIKDGKPYGFGFSLANDWMEDDDEYWDDYFIEATPEEWFSRLEEEAKKRGFNEMVKFKTFDGRVCTLLKVSHISESGSLHPEIPKNEWENSEGMYISSNPPIMDNGKWAEIIEEPKYEAGTLGAFWDGEWDDAVDEIRVYVGLFEKKLDNEFKPKNHPDTWQNFKPLKFD